MKFIFVFRVVGLWWLSVSFCLGTLSVTPLKESGIFGKSDRTAWKVVVKDSEEEIRKVSYVIKQDGGQIVREGEAELTDGGAEIVLGNQLAGIFLIEVKAGSKLKATGGAAVDPPAIPRSSARPEDFDSFWENKLQELSKTPSNPVLTTGVSDRTDVSHWYLTMDLPRGQKMQGQLARPVKDGKFPAMVIFQYAGVYQQPPRIVTSQAVSGWLVLNVCAHDLPLNEPTEYYVKQSEGPLKNYVEIGNLDREKSYFLRMYLACSRAVDFLAERQDWDGRTLVVSGTSQGGLQAIVAAALNPKVTGLAAKVPAGCDSTAPLAGRAMPWPYWLKSATNENREALIQTCAYFDAVNFAPRVKCPALVGYGLLDRTATASGICVMMNELKGPVEKFSMPASEHKDIGGTQKAYDARFKDWAKLWKSGRSPI